MESFRRTSGQPRDHEPATRTQTRRRSTARLISAIRRKAHFSARRAMLAAALTGSLAYAAYQQSDSTFGRPIGQSDISEGFIGCAIAAALIFVWNVFKVLGNQRKKSTRELDIPSIPGEERNVSRRRVGQDRSCSDRLIRVSNSTSSKRESVKAVVIEGNECGSIPGRNFLKRWSRGVYRAAERR